LKLFDSANLQALIFKVETEKKKLTTLRNRKVEIFSCDVTHLFLSDPIIILHLLAIPHISGPFESYSTWLTHTLSRRLWYWFYLWLHDSIVGSPWVLLLVPWIFSALTFL